MLSGLGPREHLRELRINVKKDLPGVGQNLMDHLEVNVGFDIDPTKFMWRWQAAYLKLFTDYKNLSPNSIKKTIEKFADQEAFASNGLNIMWDWTSGCQPSNIFEPDLHIQLYNGFFFDRNLTFPPLPQGDVLHYKEISKDSYMPNPLDPVDSKGNINYKKNYSEEQLNPASPRVIIDFLIENLHTKATGSLTLRSKDPRCNPRIELGLWKDEDAIKRVVSGIKQVRELMETPEMLSYSKNPNDSSIYELYPGVRVNTDEKLIEYIKNWQSIGHHMAGTARMGKECDPYAVVDSKLKVIGVDNLRVVDASVYPAPNHHYYNPSRGIYMIAEVASDIILEKSNLLN
jgi:choline dehydrogenase